MMKLIHVFYNMDTNAEELTNNDSSVLTIDCEEVENHYDVRGGQMADSDWLLYNATMEYASPAVRGNGELPERACSSWNRRLNNLPVYRDARYTGFLLLVLIIPAGYRTTGIAGDEISVLWRLKRVVIEYEKAN